MSLSSHPTVDHETLYRALGQLVDRVFGALKSNADNALDDCLDIVVDLLGADRGLVVVTMSDGSTFAINARHKGASLTAAEREEISKTIVRQALESSRLVVFQPSVQAIRSVTSLGIIGALAVTLRPGAGSPEGNASDGRRAVLYVDFRDVRKYIQDHHVDFFMSAALLIGAVLEQHARSETTRAHLQEARGHTTEARRTPPIRDLLGTPSMKHVLAEVESALHSNSNASILIVGESGTGKTLLAHAIAEASGKRPIVRAMLGASDDLNTITSELFGHERGAFSGANAKRVGLVEFANEGTLVLDELLNLPMHAQKLLLDFTQFGTYRPLGYQRAEPKTSSIRLITATNGDLNAAMRDGRFREDLFHRLAHVVLELPPLRARREDVPLLAEQTLRRLDPDPSRQWSLSLPMRRLLTSPAIAWSGNVRQLERVIMRARERALVRDPGATLLMPEHLEARDLDGVDPKSAAAEATPLGVGAVGGAVAGSSTTGGGATGGGAGSTVEEPASEWQRLQAERGRIDEREVDVIRAALMRNNNVVAHAARELGVARTTLASRIEVLGLKKRSTDA